MSDSGEWVAVALLGRTRGIRGELSAVPLSDGPARYETLNRVELFTRDGDPLGGFNVESVRFHDAKAIFKFEGVDSINDAEELQGAEVRVPLAERKRLEPGEYFQSDLVGCEVVDRATGKPLGRVTSWMDGGGAGLLEVEGGLLLPFAKSICVSVDVNARRIDVDLPDGLKELNHS